MRPGADRRTQQCRKCRRGDVLESNMTEAAKVLGKGGKRGWYCPNCAEITTRQVAQVKRITDAL